MNGNDHEAVGEHLEFGVATQGTHMQSLSVTVRAERDGKEPEGKIESEWRSRG